MSIHDIAYKIKGIGKSLNIRFIYPFLIILVGFGSFILGRLSVPISPISNNQNNLEVKSATYISRDIQNSQSPVLSSEEGEYVASKNGKLYYRASCKAANRIKPENRIWFNLASEAEESGYTPSSCN